MKSKSNHLLMVCAGILLMGLGLFLLKSTNLAAGSLRVLPYFCLGIGSGVFGHGAGELATRKAFRNNPQLQRELEIEQRDERNVAIANRAKGKAYDLMTFVFGALMVCFALMQIDLSAVLLLVFCYLLVQGSALYYRFKFEKEM